MAEGLKAIVRATPEIVTPADLDFRLNDHSIYSHSRQWFLADGTTSNERVFYHTFPADADSLPVILVAYSPEGCPDTAGVVVRIDRANLAIPNTFTPGESTNSTWQPAIRDIKELEVWIYNRQGLLVAHLEGLDAYWDGTHNGTPCPQGAYVYNLRYCTNHRPNKQQQETGTILLIR
jgi:gliding motility-associated-like protein